jgi:hypothetical protein
MWFTGAPRFATFTGDNEQAVAAYLDDGGSLLLSSQDYLYEMDLTQFGQNYLHVGSFVNDVGQMDVLGVNAFAGLGPYGLTFPFPDLSDMVEPDASAQVAFMGNTTNAAISYDGASFQTVFLGFPLEAVETAEAQAAILARALSFSGGCTPPTIGITPTDISATLVEGESSLAGLQISNHGQAALTFTITGTLDAPWLSASPLQGTLEPASMQPISLTLDASALNSGTYTATLEIASNDPLTPLVTVPVTLTVLSGCEPAAGPSITWYPLDPTAGLSISFSAEASGTLPLNFTWDFGDGFTATGTSVTHTFTTAGTYTTTLTVTNDCGFATSSIVIEVRSAGWQILLPIVYRP